MHHEMKNETSLPLHAERIVWPRDVDGCVLEVVSAVPGRVVAVVTRPFGDIGASLLRIVSTAAAAALLPLFCDFWLD